MDRPDDRRVAVRSAYATATAPELNDEYLRDDPNLDRLALLARSAEVTLMSKKSREEQTRGRLLSLWETEADGGSPLGCVATTFTFDAPFFEEQCLSRFAGLKNDLNEDMRAYLIQREEKLSQVFACVLVDAGHVAPLRSLRWNLLPVRPPGSGIMHAKVTLLVREHRIRVLIGSANLTEPGYRRNYEHVAVLDFSPESEIPLALLFDVLDFLERLRGLVPGSEGDGEGPATGTGALSRRNAGAGGGVGIAQLAARRAAGGLRTGISGRRYAVRLAGGTVPTSESRLRVHRQPLLRRRLGRAARDGQAAGRNESAGTAGD